jgi:Putative peptidoglycan binding domain/L,D-transpeptidase catalytic domain
MRRPVRWCLISVAAAVGAMVCSHAGVASAVAVPFARAPVGVRPGVYVPPSQDLSLGDQGAAVLSVQQRLAQLGYYPGPIDGEYGSDLEEAVWAFKEVQGLPLLSGSSLIGPDFDAALVNPQPPQALVPDGGPNRIEINQSIQVLVLYQDNQPELILHVSTGGRYYYCNKGSCGYAITPDGNFTALSYLAGDIQVPLGFMENPVFFIGRAYAIHGGDPVPWYPASHGCVRIYADAVDWFHNDVQLGVTPIYIRGTAP